LNAIILSAGYGKRLRALNSIEPKCLLKINGKPLLEIWIEKLKKIGVEKILINTHYKSERVKNYLNKSKFNKIVKISHEKKLLGTAGTLLKNIEFFENKDGFFIHADNYTQDSLRIMIRDHKKRPKNCMFTMLTHRTNVPHLCGIVEINQDKILTGFYEKQNKVKGDANSAVYLLSNEFLKKIKNKTYIDFSNEIIPKFLNKIYTSRTKFFFTDIGNIKSYSFAKKRSTFDA
tara:strand:+ start:723 stop:1418 length:696 start_codon:yes stop_codon:yes gene_type:complete